MGRISSPGGKLAAGIAWLALVAVVVVVCWRIDPPWTAIGIGIGLATVPLGRLTGGFAFAAPAAVTLPLIVLFWNGPGEYSGLFAVLLIAALACAELGALIGVWWRAWSWSGSLTK